MILALFTERGAPHLAFFATGRFATRRQQKFPNAAKLCKTVGVELRRPPRAPYCSALTPHYPGLWTVAYTSHGTQPGPHACAHQHSQKISHTTGGRRLAGGSRLARSSEWRPLAPDARLRAPSNRLGRKHGGGPSQDYHRAEGAGAPGGAPGRKG